MFIQLLWSGLRVFSNLWDYTFWYPFSVVSSAQKPMLTSLLLKSGISEIELATALTVRGRDPFQPFSQDFPHRHAHRAPYCSFALFLRRFALALHTNKHKARRNKSFTVATLPSWAPTHKQCLRTVWVRCTLLYGQTRSAQGCGSSGREENNLPQWAALIEFKCLCLQDYSRSW